VAERHVEVVPHAIGAGPVRAYVRHVRKAVAEMINGEFAKYRIDDRIREGVSARGARQLGARRAAERRVRTRRLVGVATALLSLPFKH